MIFSGHLRRYHATDRYIISLTTDVRAYILR